MSDILAKLSALERMEGNLGYPVHLVGGSYRRPDGRAGIVEWNSHFHIIGRNKTQGALIVKGPCGEAKCFRGAASHRESKSPDNSGPVEINRALPADN